MLNVAQSILSRVATRSILNPLLWLVGLVLVFFCFVLWIDREMATQFVWVVIGIVSVAVIAYVAFALFAPDRLQSEEHQQSMLLLRSIKYQDSSGQVIEGNVERINVDQLDPTADTSVASKLFSAEKAND